MALKKTITKDIYGNDVVVFDSLNAEKAGLCIQCGDALITLDAQGLVDLGNAFVDFIQHNTIEFFE